MQNLKTTYENNLQMLKHCGFWEQLLLELQEHSQEISKLSSWTENNMPTLQKQLLQCTEYQGLYHQAKTADVIRHSLVFPLFDSEQFRVNLLTITPEHSLPLHDHPGSAGAMIVLSGKINALACGHTSSSSNNSQINSMLRVVANENLSAGETSCFTQKEHNIHSFKALTERATLLVIHTPPFAASQQTYFFASSPPREIGSNLFVQRVRAQALLNLKSGTQH